MLKGRELVGAVARLYVGCVVDSERRSSGTSVAMQHAQHIAVVIIWRTASVTSSNQHFGQSSVKVLIIKLLTFIASSLDLFKSLVSWPAVFLKL